MIERPVSLNDPTRRAILTGQLGHADVAPEAHISSLVVHARHEKIAAVRDALLAMPGVEIPAESVGKLVVTLETATEADIVTRLNDISLTEGVLSAALVFHHWEADPLTEIRSEQG